MRRLHPIIVLFLAALLVAQTAAAMTAQCAELHRSKVQPCCACCEDLQADDPGARCECYQAPEEPPTTPPVVQTHRTLLAASVAPSAEAVVPCGVERLHISGVPLVPAPPFLRDADVRAPPVPR